MRRALIAVGLAGLVGFGAVACGGDDDGAGSDDVSAEAQPYVDAMKGALTTNADDIDLTDEQADCLAPRWVDAIGVDTMEDAGIEPEELSAGSEPLDGLQLSEGRSQQLADSFGQCDVSLKALVIDGMVTDNDVSDEDRECLEREFPDGLLEDMIVTVLTEGNEAAQQDDSLMSAMFAVFAKCPGVTGG